jgi:hypothetical protein
MKGAKWKDVLCEVSETVKRPMNKQHKIVIRIFVLSFFLCLGSCHFSLNVEKNLINFFFHSGNESCHVRIFQQFNSVNWFINSMTQSTMTMKFYHPFQFSAFSSFGAICWLWKMISRDLMRVNISNISRTKILLNFSYRCRENNFLCSLKLLLKIKKRKVSTTFSLRCRLKFSRRHAHTW